MFVANFIFITSLHYFFHSKVFSKVKENIKWYANHAISNSIIVLTTFSDSIRLMNCKQDCHLLKPLGGPIYSWSDYNNIELIMVTNMLVLHSYHLLYFENLRMIDYIHHILMMMIIWVAYLMNSGIYMSYFLFFVCGLPGMIDYSLLSIGFNRKKEKKINTYLNNYIRAPGIIFGMGLMWKDTYHTNSFYTLVSYLVLFWNAQYFNYEVIKNYFIIK
tara:strand:- start:205 stop:855 length:651 start_codon:yes stop_codon:yes gene_type:complete